VPFDEIVVKNPICELLTRRHLHSRQRCLRRRLTFHTFTACALLTTRPIPSDGSHNRTGRTSSRHAVTTSTLFLRVVYRRGRPRSSDTSCRICRATARCASLPADPEHQHSADRSPIFVIELLLVIGRNTLITWSASATASHALLNVVMRRTCRIGIPRHEQYVASSSVDGRNRHPDRGKIEVVRFTC